MNDLCVEIGYNSINHVGEELCGDHVEAVGQGEDSSVLVLARAWAAGLRLIFFPFLPPALSPP